MPFLRRSPAASGSARRVLPLVLLLLPALAPGAPGRAETDGDRCRASEWWGVVRLGGTPVGSVVERRRPLADGGCETTSELALALNRAGSRVEMAVTATAEEDAAGGLRRARLESRLSSQLTTVEAEVRDGTIRLRTGSGGSLPPREQLLPLAGELLGPEAARRRTLAALAAPGDRIAYRQLLPELGGVHRVERTLVARDAGGSREIEESMAGAPGLRRIRLDAAGEVEHERESTPFGDMEVVRATRAGAAAARSGGELPAALYARSLAPSAVRLPSPRGVERLRLRLVRLDPAAADSHWPDLDGGTQRVLASSDEAVEVEVTRPAAPTGPVAPSTPDAPELAEFLEFLEPGAWIESDDPEVVRLARAIVGDERDPWRQALALTAWVHREMRFDLGIVMAPASELARERRGTCAGYATLLAAFARAVGIPARYVMGSVYLLGVWGGHAWVELWIDGRWLPFDAAVYSPGLADAARLAYARDSLRDGLGLAALGALALYGQVRVEPLAGVIDGAPHDFVAPSAPTSSFAPFSLAGPRWESPGLGLTVVAPTGFTPGRVDAVWPDPTLLELVAADGRRAVLREGALDGREGKAAAAAELAALGLPAGSDWRALAGEPALSRAAPGRAGAAWVRGTQLVTLVVDGAAPDATLAAVVAGLRWQSPGRPAQASSADGP